RTAYDGRIGPDRRTAPDQGLFILRAADDLRARIRHIREDARRAAENIILDDQPRVQRYVVLYLDVVTHFYVGRDAHILTDVAVLPDRAVLHDMGEMP